MDARGRGAPDRIRSGTATAVFAAGLALAVLVGMPFTAAGDRPIAGRRGAATTEATDRLGLVDGGPAHARSAVGRPDLAAATPDADGWVRLADGLPDYAPAGLPDFDQRQTTWRVPAPDGDKWTHDGPVAAANALWWLDSLREPGSTPPQEVADGYGLVPAIGPWDDHDHRNVRPLVFDLAGRMQTTATGEQRSMGTCADDLVAGLAEVIGALDPPGSVTAVDVPDVARLADAIGHGRAVVLLVGLWQFQDALGWERLGGHYVTLEAVDPLLGRLRVSDPFRDEAAPSGHPNDHNPADLASHDAWVVSPSMRPDTPLRLDGYLDPPPDPVELLSQFHGQNSRTCDGHDVPWVETATLEALVDLAVIIDVPPPATPEPTVSPAPSSTIPPSATVPISPTAPISGTAPISSTPTVSASVTITPTATAMSTPPPDAAVGEPQIAWLSDGHADYAPAGVPDFSQCRGPWSRPGSPAQWTHAAPVAAADALWWLDSVAEADPHSPPLVHDGHPLVTAYPDFGPPTDDHVAANLTALVDDLALRANTNGVRKIEELRGTRWEDLVDALRDYVADRHLADTYAVVASEAAPPSWMAEQASAGAAVVVLLGVWEHQPGGWRRVGGHYAALAGADAGGTWVALSDPLADSAANGGDGRAIPPGEPVHSCREAPRAHDDAAVVAHDAYAAYGVEGLPPGELALAGYFAPETFGEAAAFRDQNPADFLADRSATWARGSVVMALDAAVAIRPAVAPTARATPTSGARPTSTATPTPSGNATSVPSPTSPLTPTSPSPSPSSPSTASPGVTGTATPLGSTTPDGPSDRRRLYLPVACSPGPVGDR